MEQPEPVLSAEDRYRLLAENASDIVYQTDAARNIEWISPSVTTLLGYEFEDIVGRPAASLLSPNQNLDWVRRNREALDSGGSVAQELLLRAKDGTERWFSGRAQPHRDESGTLRYVVGMHDIHDQVAARERLMQSEEMFRAAMMSASSGMALLDPEGRIIETNQALCNFLGAGADELLGRTWEEFTHASDFARENVYFQDMRVGRRDTFRMTKKYLHGSGSTRVGDLSCAAVRGDDGEIRLFINQIVDMTEQAQTREHLLRLATVDTLTGLPNHSHIINELEAVLTTLDPTQRTVAVLVIDISDFKKINDSLGREAGDYVLRILAGHLKEGLPASGRIGRFGGDEFLVVIPSAEESEISVLCGLISKIVEEEIQIQGRRIVLTCCIGAALSGDDAAAETLLRDANAALAMAKRAAKAQPGRSQFELFDRAHASMANQQRLILEEQIRYAIERREFVVHYQPIIRLKTGERAGFEALVRWFHPSEGLMRPDAFLPVAEESGLIAKIGEQVLEDVCRDAVAHADLDGFIGVNVSQVQLADKGWLDSVLRVLERTGLDPRRLVIEITETAVMATNRRIDEDLRALRELGVEIAVDDFGTGYSSVALLRDLPVTHLKLDRSFVSTLGGISDPGHALAEGLAKLAESIGLDGVAEGIETPEQATYLRAMGWPYGQGYFFGRPAPLEHWLDQAAQAEGRS